MKAKIILAPEYDEADFICLRQVVEALDGSIHSPSWALAGSVEISMWSITFPQGKLTAMAENYEGLSIQGPKNLVQRVADVFNSTVKRSSHL
jgi:hypothetical protein